jgi:hypothetical protein
MVVETDGAEGTGGVTALTGFGTRGVLTQQAAIGLLINIKEWFHRLDLIGFLRAKIRKKHRTAKPLTFFHRGGLNISGVSGLYRQNAIKKKQKVTDNHDR